MKSFLAILCSLFLSASFSSNAVAQPRALNIFVQASVQHSIHQDDGRYQYALQSFKAKYPDVDVKLQQIGVLSPDEYQKALMDKNRDIDIILLLNPDTQSYAASGLVVPLSDQADFAEAITNWPEGTLMPARDGKIYSVPHWIKAMLCQINLPEVYKALNLDFSGGWRWDELFAIAPVLAAYNEEHGTNHTLIAFEGAAPHVIAQLAAASQSGLGMPDRAVIEGLLTGSAALKKGDFSDARANAPENALFEFRLADLKRASRYLPMPLYAKGAVGSELFIDSLMVSAMSDMTEEALDFLTFYSHPKALESSSEFFSLGIYPAGMNTDVPAWYIQTIREGFSRKANSIYRAMCDAYVSYEDGLLPLNETVNAILNAK